MDNMEEMDKCLERYNLLTLNQVENIINTAITSTKNLLSFPCGSAGKESTCNTGDRGSIPGLGRSPGERKGYPLQYSGLENSMGCIVHGVTNSRTRLSDLHFHFQQTKVQDLMASQVDLIKHLEKS